jgi:hypothetical protein
VAGFRAEDYQTSFPFWRTPSSGLFGPQAFAGIDDFGSFLDADFRAVPGIVGPRMALVISSERKKTFFAREAGFPS